MTIGGDQGVLHLGPGNIRAGDLQRVDRLVDFVVEVDAVFGGEQSVACGAEEIGNRPRTYFGTFEILCAVALSRRATYEHEQHKHKSDVSPAAFERDRQARLCKFRHAKPEHSK